jgi:hypothetical protein
MTGTVDGPLLAEGMAVGIGMQRAAVSPPARYLTLLHCGRGLQSGGRGAACPRLTFSIYRGKSLEETILILDRRC